MTSKEALNRLMILARPCDYEVREHRNSYCDRLENVIEQDLDRLEELENENFELRQKLNTEEECVVMLQKAIDKYKKVIKILKQHIEVYIYFGQSTINVTDYDLIQEEYELLKEVLEDEK